MSTDTSMGEKPITIQEVADFLGVCPQTVKKLATRRDNPLPAHPLTDSTWRFVASEVKAWFAESRIVAGEPPPIVTPAVRGIPRSAERKRLK